MLGSAHTFYLVSANFLPFDFVLTKKVCTFAVEYRRNVVNDAVTTDAPEEAADVNILKY